MRRFRTLLLSKASSTSGLVSRFLRWLERVFADYTNVQSLGLWISAIVTGVVAVLYAQAFRFVESLTLKILSVEPYLIFVSTPLFFLGAWWLVDRFAPEAVGSGIPQVMAAIETPYEGQKVAFVDRLLSFRTAFVKILSSLLCVAGGGGIGREGPTLQVSAAVFHGFGRVVRRYYPRSDEQTWVIAGAAAGLASAFNTPLGGIVYAIEELGMHHFHRVRTALLTAVIISGLVAQALIGSYLYLGFPRLHVVNLSQWSLVILTGLVSGLAGALFCRCLLLFSGQRKRIQGLKKKAGFALLMGLLMATLIYIEPLANGSGGELISDILFRGEAASFGLTLSRLMGTAIAYLSGAAGGVFSPSLAIGASIGSKIAYLFQSDNGNLFAMLGMIGFLTGVTHTPFTSFILVMEMSDRHSAIFPMMVSALIANSIAKSVQQKSFYEVLRDDFLKSS